MPNSTEPFNSIKTIGIMKGSGDNDWRTVTGSLQIWYDKMTRLYTGGLLKQLTGLTELEIADIQVMAEYAWRSAGHVNNGTP